MAAAQDLPSDPARRLRSVAGADPALRCCGHIRYREQSWNLPRGLVVGCSEQGALCRRVRKACGGSAAGATPSLPSCEFISAALRLLISSAALFLQL